MSEQSFNIVFAGELVGGADPDRVRENLGKLFKMDAERVEKLFSGKPVVIKKQADQATAMKFRAALRQAGAQCQMVPADAPEPDSDVPAAPAAGDTDAGSASSSSGKAVFEARDPSPAASPAPAPVEEVEPAPAPEPAQPEPAAAAPPQAAVAPARDGSPGPETVGTIRTGGTGFSGEFDVAPVGAELDEKRDTPPPITPDISHLSMAEAGADLEQIKEEKEIKVPDISHLSVAPDNGQ